MPPWLLELCGSCAGGAVDDRAAVRSVPPDCAGLRVAKGPPLAK